MSIERLWNDPEDFYKSLDAGIKLIAEETLLSSVDPADEDKSTLKSLLATYVTGVIDPEKIMDSELSQKLLVVRMTMLAAYNLGRERGNSEVRARIQELAYLYHQDQPKVVQLTFLKFVCRN